MWNHHPYNFQDFNGSSMVWIVSPKNIYWNPRPEYLWMWTYLEIESLQLYQVKMKSYWIRVNPNPTTSVLRGKPVHRNIQGEHHVMMTEADCSNTSRVKEYQALPEIKDGHFTLSLKPSAWTDLATPWFRFLASRTVRKWVLSHPVCVNLLWQL